MAGMRLPKSFMLVILGKHHSSIYREFNRNGSGGVYTGTEAQATSEQRRLEHKPSPKTSDAALMREIVALFKEDLSPDQISGRLRVEHPSRPEKQASPSTIYPQLYEETAKDPLLKEHVRQNRTSEAEEKTAGDR
jgi:IS30 family transposase